MADQKPPMEFDDVQSIEEAFRLALTKVVEGYPDLADNPINLIIAQRMFASGAGAVLALTHKALTSDGLGSLVADPTLLPATATSTREITAWVWGLAEQVMQGRGQEHMMHLMADAQTILLSKRMRDARDPHAPGGPFEGDEPDGR